MLDIENIVIDMVTDLLEPLYPGITVASEDVPVVESFPFVTVYVQDNHTIQRTRVFGDPLEHHAGITLTVNVYSNKDPDKRAVVKEIFSTIDGFLQSQNFTRTMAGPTPNVDETVARFTGRYSAVVGRPTEQEIDGNTVSVFPVYRG